MTTAKDPKLDNSRQIETTQSSPWSADSDAGSSSNTCRVLRRFLAEKQASKQCFVSDPYHLKILQKYGSSIPSKHEFNELQKTAQMGTAHTLRKVLI
jgi:hypothetical protein